MPELTPEEVSVKVQEISRPFLTAAGVDLVELKVGCRNQDMMIQFMADKPNGGITIQECATLNRSIVDAIDADGFLGENYSLEFSSPGLDRPLYNDKDFLRNINYPVRIHLLEAVQLKKEWVGKIIRVNTENVVILTKQKKEIVVPLTVIENAVLVI